MQRKALWGSSGPWWIFSAIVLSKSTLANVDITREQGVTTFWHNASSTKEASFIFSACDILNCPAGGLKYGEAYICYCDNAWGWDCDYWGAAAWNTGDPWGYNPTSLENWKPGLRKRMSIVKVSSQHPWKPKLAININNPQPTDVGRFVLGWWYGGGSRGHRSRFNILEMETMKQEYTKAKSPSSTSDVVPRLSIFKDMTAISDPTFEEIMTIETGSSESNLWLEWMRYNARTHNTSDCYVCGHGRPHLGTVPLNIPTDQENCFFSLYTNTHTNDTKCEEWKKKYPLLSKNPEPGSTITPYPGNYTCYISSQNTSMNYGKFPPGYCSENRTTYVGNHTRSLGDIYWLCGDMKLRVKLESVWKGECALAQIIMPLHILPEHHLDNENRVGEFSRKKRDNVPGGSLDPHVYIDSIGVPRGVPNEFKARDQVAAGFESLIPQITINKNVDWINYIYYNQQRFVNYTRDALQGVAEQLGATSQMAFQDRMALDMMLAEKGGTCVYISKVEGCCTYIPDQTGPNGRVTAAINKLTDLSVELKRNSGIDNPWDQYFGWFTNWKQALIQICLILLIVFVVFFVTMFCILPCCKKLASRGIDQVLYQTVNKTDTPEAYAAYLASYREAQARTNQRISKNHII